MLLLIALIVRDIEEIAYANMCSKNVIQHAIRVLSS